MVKVLKRRGYTKRFDEGKVRKSIQKAVLDAGYTLEEKKDLINEVATSVTKKSNEKGEIDTKTIRESILVKIEEVSPSV